MEVLTPAASFTPLHPARLQLNPPLNPPPPNPQPADQTSCCGLVDAAATGGTVACGASGLVLTVPSTDFAAITASLTVTGKAGNTATTNSAILESLTCSNRFGDATWGSAGGATNLAVAAGTDLTCSTGTDGSCQGLVDRISPESKTSISSRHSCTIRATDGAVLCSGNNLVSSSSREASDSWRSHARCLHAAGPRLLRLSLTDLPSCAPVKPKSPPLPRPPYPQQYGNLGTGTTTSSTSLVAVLAPGSGSTILTGATQIAVGARIDSISPSGQSCACLSSGEAVCWGQNAGPVRARGMQALPLAHDCMTACVAAGHTHATRRCCYSNRRCLPPCAPQLAVAIPLTTTTVRRPAYVMTDAASTTRLTNCKFVSASGNTTLFLTTTGDIYAAGRNACEPTLAACFAAAKPTVQTYASIALAWPPTHLHTLSSPTIPILQPLPTRL